MQTTTTVAILASDRITADGALAYLRHRPELELLPRHRHQSADVALLLVNEVTEDTLGIMEVAAAASTNDDLRIVLVADALQQRQLLRAVKFGLVSVVPRGEATYERIVRAVVNSRRGRPDLPDEMVGWLVDQNRSIQRDVLEPRGLTATGLESRELTVVKLLAEGLDTSEIAERLNYSERTVKNVLHDMMSRLSLRNRPHAVAYALRCGAL